MTYTMKMMSKILLIFSLLSIKILSAKEIKMNVLPVSFKAKEGVNLFFNIEIDNSELTFIDADSLQVAPCSFQINVFGSENQLYYTRQWDKQIVQKNNTSDSTQKFFDEMSITLKEKGDFKILLSVYQPNSKERGFWEKTLKIDTFYEDFSVSDVLFSYKIVPTEKNNIFCHRGYYTLPNAKLEFGELGNVLYFYYEVYNAPELNGKYEVTEKMEFYTKAGEYVKATEPRKIAGKGENLYIASAVMINDLFTGDYVLRHIISDSENKKQITKLYDISIINNELSENNLIEFSEDEVKMSEFILNFEGSKKENRLYHSLNDDGKQEFLRRFWLKQSTAEDADKTKNAKFLKYLERYQTAKNIYSESTMRRDDRVRYYIKYGYPDEKDKHYVGNDSYSDHEVWRYAAPDSKMFVFYDVSEDGVFRLIYTSDNPDSYEEKYKALIEYYKRF